VIGLISDSVNKFSDKTLKLITEHKTRVNRYRQNEKFDFYEDVMFDAIFEELELLERYEK
jgi:hypothetical protein